jgi:alpha-beta hydrolase superfamily lysophospholipase
MKYYLTFLFLLVSSNALAAVHPSKKYVITPDSLNLPYQQLTLHTPDGYNLNAWEIPPLQHSRHITIVVAYGDAGNMSYYVYQARALAMHGYTVLLFDYRGFGKSQDFKINYDYLYYNAFVTDLATAVDWAKKNIPNRETGIWGLSMGAIIATFALHKMQADFLIAEGFPYSLREIQEKNDKKGNKVILPKGYQHYQSLLKNIDTPMLIFAGKKDKKTPLKGAKKIAGFKSNRKLIVYNDKHLRGFWKLTKKRFGDDYCQKITSFIKKQKGWHANW